MVHSALNHTEIVCYCPVIPTYLFCVCLVPDMALHTTCCYNWGVQNQRWMTTLLTKMAWHKLLTCCTCGQSQLNSQCSLQNPGFKLRDLISFMPNLTTSPPPPPPKSKAKGGKKNQQSSTRMATTGEHNAESSGNSTTNLWQEIRIYCSVPMGLFTIYICRQEVETI